MKKTLILVIVLSVGAMIGKGYSDYKNFMSTKTEVEVFDQELFDRNMISLYSDMVNEYEQMTPEELNEEDNMWNYLYAKSELEELTAKYTY